VYQLSTDERATALTTPATTVAVGILAPVVAKAGQEAALTAFLNAGYDLALTEPATAHWFALQYTAVADVPAVGPPTTFAIFDTFAAPAGRAAHLAGPIAAALMANAAALLDGAPEIGAVDVLASVVRAAGAGAGRTAGLSVGLRVLFEAQEGKADVVSEFLVVSGRAGWWGRVRGRRCALSVLTSASAP
jgi:quinol monooxygenase YgiN